MAVTIYPPNTAPTLSALWPDPTADDLGTSFADWVGSGGISGNNPPDPTWYLAVADLPGTVESRTDGTHVEDQLVFTAVGGETTVNFTLTAPVCPSSLFITNTPFNRATFNPASPDTFYHMEAADQGGQLMASFYGSFAIVAGNLTAVLNNGGTGLAVGREFTVSGRAQLNGSEDFLHGLKIVIDDNGGNAPGGTLLAHFVGTIPPDYSSGSGGHGYITPNTSTAISTIGPKLTGTGTLNYLTGQVSIPSVALTAGDKFYASYDVRGGNFISGNQAWTGLANLAAGSGSAEINPLLPSTYDPIYGNYFNNNSHWLVCRNFGFPLPSNAVVQHIAFAWSGTGTATGDIASLYLMNPILFVGNLPRSAIGTQKQGDLSDSYYAWRGTDNYWPPNDNKWPGADHGGTEYAGSDYWDNFFQGENSVNRFVGYTGLDSTIGDTPHIITPTNVNDSGFGFGVAVNFGYPGGSTYANGYTAHPTVSGVRMMVWYTVPNTCGRVTITGVFQDAAGNPLANGTIRVYLYNDCQTCDNKELGAGIFCDTALDGSGAIPNGNLRLYPSSQLTGSGPDVGTYRIQVYSATGQLAWHNRRVTIPVTNPFDLSNLS